MAVYTPLSNEEVSEFLTRYDIGALASCAGIAEGVENSNFLLTVSSSLPCGEGEEKYILTLFEKRVRMEDLPYFLHLMEHLRARGIACPLPVRMRDGRLLGALKEKPAAIVSFLEGRNSPAPIRPEHLHLLGELAARMHMAGADYPHRRENALGPAGWEALAGAIGERAEEIAPGLAALLREECAALQEHWPSGLPGGAVHADLFPDNVFFSEVRAGNLRISGVIDFYFACHDAWAYDLAISVNAWCFDARNRFVPERAQALMQAYTALRPMTPEEERAMPLLLRGAALRFLLTRAHDALFHPQGALVTPKDPLEYLAKLEFFRSRPWH